MWLLGQESGASWELAQSRVTSWFSGRKNLQPEVFTAAQDTQEVCELCITQGDMISKEPPLECLWVNLPTFQGR